MINKLKNNIIQIVGKNPPNLMEVLSCFRSSKFRKDEYLLREGDVCKHIHYVNKGLLQITKVDSQFNEITTDLILENNWFTDVYSFKNGVKSNLSVKANRLTEVYSINKQSFEILMQKVPKFADAYIKIIEEKYKESTERVIALNTLEAKDKIQWLRNFRPEMFQKAPDKLIAEYLGISKGTFCRLK